MSSFRRHAKRDPRFGRIRGGSFGTRSTKQVRRISSLDPFFAENGTHRTHQVDARSSPRSEGYGLRRYCTPGPGAYKTPYTLGVTIGLNDCDASRSVLKRFPQPVVSGHRRVRADLLAPGPFDYSPMCGYTSCM
jgi:hypothetical protein